MQEKVISIGKEDVKWTLFLDESYLEKIVKTPQKTLLQINEFNGVVDKTTKNWSHFYKLKMNSPP